MEKHLEALEKVRKSCICNMFDAHCVWKTLVEIREFETAHYLLDEGKGEVNLIRYTDLLYELGERRKLKKIAD